MLDRLHGHVVSPATVFRAPLAGRLRPCIAANRSFVESKRAKKRPTSGNRHAQCAHPPRLVLELHKRLGLSRKQYKAAMRKPPIGTRRVEYVTSVLRKYGQCPTGAQPASFRCLTAEVQSNGFVFAAQHREATGCHPHP